MNEAFRQAVLEASARQEACRAVHDLYDRLEQEIAARRPICIASRFFANIRARRSCRARRSRAQASVSPWLVRVRKTAARGLPWMLLQKPFALRPSEAGGKEPASILSEPLKSAMNSAGTS